MGRQPEDSMEKERQVVSFPQWQEVLAKEPFSAAQAAAFRHEIFGFLRVCKLRHAGASIILAKEYLASVREQDANAAREALRWWFVAARRGRVTEVLRGLSPLSLCAGRCGSRRLITAGSLIRPTSIPHLYMD